jgi:hypothetical protein
MRLSPTLLRACGRGSQAACDIAKKLKVMYAASVLTFANVNDKSDNPNHLPFTGTLLLVDVASDKPPHGSEGHRIYVSSNAAKRAIIDLPGQAVNYQPDGLNAHASRHKVGVITKAWMEGSKVKVSGFIWVHDFPEAKILKNRSDLGMSMELANVYVKDEDADVWNLEKFDFTGGTILKKSAAAYTKTDLAAVAAAAEEKRGASMAKHSDEKKHRKVAAAHKDTGQDPNLALVVQALSGSLGPAMERAMGPVVTEIKASGQRFEDGLEEIRGHLYTMQAAAQNNDEDEDDDEIVVHAARHEDASASASEEEEEAEEMEASASSSGSASMAAARKKGGGVDNFGDDDDSSSSASASDSSMEAALEDMGLEDASEEPGEVNTKGNQKGDVNKGRKTTVTDPPTQGEHFKGNVAKGRLHSAADRGGKVKKNTRHVTTSSIQAAAMIGDLQASVRQIRRQLKAQSAEHEVTVGKLRKKLSRVQAQAARFAELEGRHSRMSAELVNLGDKVGVDFNEARVGGQKFSVRAFDSILAAAEQSGVILNPQQRIAMKMLADQEGLLDEGVVNRMGRA